LAWTIEYTDTAKGQLRKLDQQMARRIVDFMDERIAGRDNPRDSGKALTGSLGGLWRYRVGDSGDLRYSGWCLACARGADWQPA